MQPPRLSIPKMGSIMPSMGTPLADTAAAAALFPQVRQRLLAILFGQPERSFYANELIRLATSGTGAVQRELESLTAAGLVTAQRLGNQRHYQANADSPIFNELRAIVVKTSGIELRLQQALAPLFDEIRWAFVYGSAAKGTLHAGSDIDLMIVSDALTLESVFSALAPAEADLGRKINPSVYTRKEFKDRKRAGNSFLSKVLAGARVNLVGSEDGLA